MYSYNQPQTVICFRQWANKGYAAFSSLHKIIKIGVVTFCCTLVQNEYQPLMAQTDTARVSEDVQIEEIEVTAGRNELRAGPSCPMAVKSFEQIQANPANGINDVLKHLPGLDIRQRGADDIQADISLRGSSFDQVLILLNGVNITDPQTGHYNLDLPVELSQIKQIEMLQGSDARLYGSNAFGGAINIITQDDGDTAPIQTADSLVVKALSSSQRGSIQLNGGSFGKYGGILQASFGNEVLPTKISISHKHSDGYMENTDYNLSNIYLSSIYQREKIGKIQLQAGYQQKDYGANSFYSFSYPHQFEATKTLFGTAEWEKALQKNLLLKAGLYERRHHDRFELFRNNENAPSWYSGHNYHLSDVSGVHLSSFLYEKNGKTSLRAEFRNEHIYSNVLGYSMLSDNGEAETRTDPLDPGAVFTKEKNRSHLRLYANQLYRLGKFDLSAGLSGIYNSDYAFRWYGGGDITYHINKHLNSSLQYNHSLRLPTFTDLFYSSATQIGNPDILPETADTWEWNINWQTTAVNVYANFWHRRSMNTIDWVKQPDSVKWECRNLTEIKATGFEDGFAYQFNRNGIGRFIKSVGINYSHQYLDKDAGELDSKYALDYLRNKADAEIGFRLMDSRKCGEISAQLQYTFKDRAGDYTDFSTGKKTSYQPYQLIDLRLAWQYKRYRLHIDLHNITATEYADLGGLPQPGFELNGGCSIAF